MCVDNKKEEQWKKQISIYLERPEVDAECVEWSVPVFIAQPMARLVVSPAEAVKGVQRAVLLHGGMQPAFHLCPTSSRQVGPTGLTSSLYLPT